MEQNGLWLIGLGPGDLQQMTVAALAAARDADHRFLEGYTALLPPRELESMEGLIGTWEMRMRSAVEEPHELLSLAQTSKVALLVVGDPLQATTHVDLQIRKSFLKNIFPSGVSGIGLTKKQNEQKKKEPPRRDGSGRDHQF